MSSPNPRPQREREPSADSSALHTLRDSRDSGFLRRSWHAMADLMSPFSAGALAQLPKNVSRPVRYTRADGIPDVATEEHGDQPTVRDYHAITSVPPLVKVPKKVATPVKVEAKVWFANERTWVSYLNISILMATLAIALFNASKDNVGRYFAYVYAIISIGTLIYGYALYQYRITLIRRRHPGNFDQITGPVIISVLLFVAVFTNFIIRAKELQREGVTIPQLLAAAF